MINGKNKKILTRRMIVTLFFVFLTAGSFLFGRNVLAYTGDYNKAVNGSLSASEWNNLINDFVAIYAGGNAGIGTTTPIAKLDIWGNLRTDSGNFITDGAGNLTFESLFDKSNVLYKMDLSNAGISLNAAGSIISTGGIVGASGTGNNYFMGNVGIGTTNPTAKLYINSGGGANSGVVIRSDGSTGGYASLDYVNKNNVRLQTGLYDSGDAFFYMSSAGNKIGFYTNDLQRMTIAKDGNVGIGTANPGRKLVVQTAMGPSSYAAHFMQSGTTVGNSTLLGFAIEAQGWSKGAIGFKRTGSYDTGDLVFLNRSVATDGSSATTENDTKMVITSLGNVGIGTTTPTTAKLVVVPSGTYSIDAGNGRIGNLGTPALDTDAATVAYVKSIAAGTSSVPTVGYWTASGTSIYSANTGNVGIGTISPSTKLDVEGVISSGHSLGAGEIRSYQTPGYYVSLKTVTPKSGIYRNNADFFLYYNTSDGNINMDATYSGASNIFRIGGVEKMRIANSGNVGIGTTTPSAALDIFGKAKITSAGTIYNTDSTRYLDMTGVLSDSLKVSGNIYTTAGLFKSDSTGNNYMLGNLGIGTTTPTGARLDVNGLIKMRVASTSITSAEDVVNKGYVDSQIVTTVGSINTMAKFFNVTNATYYGNNALFGAGFAITPGYTQADAACNNDWPGTHVCTSEEILNTIRSGGTMPPNNSVVWIQNGPPGYTTEANDCDGRTSNRSTSYSSVWQMDSTKWPNGRGMLTVCSNYNKFACCK